MTKPTDQTIKGRVSRRNFTKGLSADSAAAALATTLPDAARAVVSRRKVRYGMVIDTHRWIGRHASSVACKAEFDVPLGSTRSWVEYVEKGRSPYVAS